MRSDSEANTPGYRSEDYDALMDKANDQLDPTSRRLYLEEAERQFLNDHALIPIYFYVGKRLVRPELRGWQDNTLNYHYSQHLSLDTPE